MSKQIDVLDIEIEPYFTVRDSIIHDVTRDFSMDELLRSYSHYGITVLDINRALDSIDWYGD